MSGVIVGINGGGVEVSVVLWVLPLPLPLPLPLSLFEPPQLVLLLLPLLSPPLPLLPPPLLPSPVRPISRLISSPEGGGVEAVLGRDSFKSFCNSSKHCPGCAAKSITAMREGGL